MREPQDRRQDDLSKLLWSIRSQQSDAPEQRGGSRNVENSSCFPQVQRTPRGKKQGPWQRRLCQTLPKGSSCWGQGLISVAPCRQQPPRAGAAGTRLGQGHWGAAAAGVAPSSRRDTECGSPASPPGLRAGHPPRYLMAPPAPGCRLFPHPGVPHPARKHPPAVQTRAVCE